ncbi:MAG TPA: hypothetical protein DCX54_03245, partial [Flavobacteriales bacterium]|nr:hypothetical protein [Flavobacteriales bacterium]
IYLLFSILSTSAIFVIFKWLGKLQTNTFLVIVLNYIFAGAIGWIMEGGGFVDKVIQSNWAAVTVLLGACFVGMFYLMAVTTHRSGTSSTVTANKMSVVIPVAAAFLLYDDDVSILKILGITLALIGIFLVTRSKQTERNQGRNVWLLILIFAGSGMIDTIIKLIEQKYLSGTDVIAFTSVLFLTAFVMGMLIVLLQLKKTRRTFNARMIFLGLLLGIVNFGSIYFLVLALKHGGIQSSVLFPLNNIGIVITATVFSILLFKEQLSSFKIAGIVVSIVSLLVLMLAT